MNHVKVSICCLVFNHERYLRKCLDGFINQKTSFEFEILIHDDASCDQSVEIIREYVQRYPEIIKPVYQTENQYSQGKKVSWIYQFPRSKGKYIAFCEGDDYWCDENKLQIQYEEMEKNSDAVLCVHDVLVINEDGCMMDYSFPKKCVQQKVLVPREMMKIMEENEMYPFQTSSYFIKAEYIKNLYHNSPKFMNVSNVGDIPLMLYSLTKGNVLYINQILSHYRINSVCGWNAIYRNTKKMKISQIKVDIASYYLFDDYTNGSYEDILENVISRQMFNMFLLKKNYKILFSLPYNKYLREFSMKNRVYFKLLSRYPSVEKIYNRFKGGK